MNGTNVITKGRLGTGADIVTKGRITFTLLIKWKREYIRLKSYVYSILNLDSNL